MKYAGTLSSSHKMVSGTEMPFSCQEVFTEGSPLSSEERAVWRGDGGEVSGAAAQVFNHRFAQMKAQIYTEVWQGCCAAEDFSRRDRGA